MTIAAVFAAVSMNAQVYVGGSLAFESWSSQKLAGDKSETVFKLLPEIGYNLSDEWAIGTVIGYQSDKFHGVEGVSETAFSFEPYVRYTFANVGKLNFFVDGGLGFTSATKLDWSDLYVGFKPGVAVNLADNVSFVTHLGFVGFEEYNPDGDDNNVTKFGLDFSGSNLTFGLYFSF